MPKLNTFDKLLFLFNKKKKIITQSGFSEIEIIYRDGEKFVIECFRDQENNTVIIYSEKHRKAHESEKYARIFSFDDEKNDVLEYLFKIGFQEVRIETQYVTTYKRDNWKK